MQSRSGGEKPPRHPSFLEEQIRAEMKIGITLSADPLNANLPELALRTTTINSAWYGSTCAFCKDKFRAGDQVLLCPLCSEPYHSDRRYNLNCWQKKFTEGAVCKEGLVDDRFDQSEQDVPRCDFSPTAAQRAASLAADTSEEDMLTGGPHLHHSPDAVLIKQFVGGIETIWRPFGELERIKVTEEMDLAGHICHQCRFPIRIDDWVVKCPCQSNCGIHFHQDIFRRMTCWNGWNGLDGKDYCPGTGAEYPESVKNKMREQI